MALPTSEWPRVEALLQCMDLVHDTIDQQTLISELWTSAYGEIYALASDLMYTTIPR